MDTLKNFMSIYLTQGTIFGIIRIMVTSSCSSQQFPLVESSLSSQIHGLQSLHLSAHKLAFSSSARETSYEPR
jgi:hypothetical protein